MLTQNEILLLKQAFDEKDRIYFSSLPSRDELLDISFSPKFERRMQRLLLRAQKVYYPMINTLAKRVACFILSVVALLSITTMSVEALREPFFQFVVKTYETFADLFFPTNDETAPFIPCSPGYIPPGYKQISHDQGITYVRITYRNSEGKEITYSQMHNTGGTTSTIDIQEAYFEKLMLTNDTEAIYMEKKGTRLIYFKNENNIFKIMGQLPKEELVAMANSLIK